MTESALKSAIEIALIGESHFFLFPFYANYELSPPIVREGPALRGLGQIVARLVQCYLVSEMGTRRWRVGRLEALVRVVWRMSAPELSQGVDLPD